MPCGCRATRVSVLITIALFDMNLIKTGSHYCYRSVKAAFYLPTETGYYTDLFQHGDSRLIPLFSLTRTSQCSDLQFNANLTHRSHHHMLFLCPWFIENTLCSGSVLTYKKQQQKKQGNKRISWNRNKIHRNEKTST